MMAGSSVQQPRKGASVVVLPTRRMDQVCGIRTMYMMVWEIMWYFGREREHVNGCLRGGALCVCVCLERWCVC